MKMNLENEVHMLKRRCEVSIQELVNAAYYTNIPHKGQTQNPSQHIKSKHDMHHRKIIM
jgi:hypothetical protein